MANPRSLTFGEYQQRESDGGLPYVDLVLGPVELGNISSPYEFLPAPGNPTDLIIPLFSRWQWLPGTLCYDGTFYPTIVYTDINQPVSALGGAVLDLTSKNYIQAIDTAPLGNGAFNQDPDSVGTGKGLSVRDASLNVFAGGSGVVIARLFYVTIEASTATAPPSFFTVTSVDQETQTFRVNGNATVLRSTFPIVGSTGNNGTFSKLSATEIGTPRDITGVSGDTYTVAGDRTAEFPAGCVIVVAGRNNADDNGYRTVASSTFDTDHTDVSITYAPEHTEVEGTITRSATDIVVIESIPDATADGWVKQ